MENMPSKVKWWLSIVVLHVFANENAMCHPKDAIQRMLKGNASHNTTWPHGCASTKFFALRIWGNAAGRGCQNQPKRLQRQIPYTFHRMERKMQDIAKSLLPTSKGPKRSTKKQEVTSNPKSDVWKYRETFCVCQWGNYLQFGEWSQRPIGASLSPNFLFYTIHISNQFQAICIGLCHDML